jgi:iron complex outermembrane receptor protein
VSHTPRHVSSRRIRRLLSLVVIAAFAAWRPAVAGAQRAARPAAGIRGVVLDSASGLPVIAAEVRLVEAHRVERTHDDGRFEFPDLPVGRHTLTARRIGYRLLSKTIALQAGQQDEVRLLLQPAAVELAPSVVTGALTERAGDEVLSPTAVLSGAALDRTLEATLAASLQSQPGVSVTSISPATARPVIRGLSGDRIVVLEDGQRPGDLSAMSGDHAVTIDPLTAHQIEVVRGPMSLLYGSSALGGVVNVVREEIPVSRPDRAHGALSVQAASVNRGASVGGHGVASRGPLAVRLEGSARGANDTQTPVGRLVNTGVQEVSLSAGASIIGNWGHAGASYRFYDNSYGIPGGFVGGHDRGVDIEMRRHTLRGAADLHVERGPVSNLAATGTFTDYHHTEFEPSGAAGTTFAQAFFVGELTARHTSVGPIALGAAGVRAQYRDITTGGTLRTPSTYDVSLAGFLVEEFGTGPLRLQGGLRYDWARYVPRERTFIDVGGVRVPVRPRRFGAISASLGVLYEATSGVRFGASVNRAHRTPDFVELYSNGPHLAANAFIVGDPELSQETGLGIDVFARVSRGPVNAEIAAFRNVLSDFIFESSRGRAEVGPQGGRPRFQYTNEGALFAGAEARVDWSPSRSIVLDATVSYVRARFTGARDSLPVITATDTTFVAASSSPPFIPPLNGQLGVRLDRTRWFAGAGARFAARQDRLGDFEDPTAAYLVPNANVGIRIVRGSNLHTLTLRVDNAFDREYRDHLSRIKAIMPEPGRNLSLLYRLTF